MCVGCLSEGGCVLLGISNGRICESTQTLRLIRLKVHLWLRWKWCCQNHLRAGPRVYAVQRWNVYKRRMRLTGHVRPKTIFNSCPRQPEASSRLHLLKIFISTPKQSASIWTIFVSCMSYLLRISSSGKSSRKHIAVVFGGRGEKRLRSSVTHLRNTWRAG